MSQVMHEHDLTSATPGRRLTGRAVAVWLMAVAFVATAHALVSVAASYWRMSDWNSRLPAVNAALAHERAVIAVLPSVPAHRLAISSEPAAAMPLDLDLGRVAVQTLATALVFGALLALAMVLAAHGRRMAAVVAAATIAVPVGLASGVLALASPLVPSDVDVSEAWLADFPGWSSTWGDVPVALLDARTAVYRAVGVQALTAWWTWSIGVVLALVAVVAVLVLMRDRDPLPIPAGRPAPIATGLVVGAVGLLAAAVVEPELWTIIVWQRWFVAATLLLAVVAAAAAATSRWWTALLLTAALLAAHAVLYVAYSDMGGLNPRWQVGDGTYATTGSAVVLALAPLAGWLVATSWAALHRATTRRERVHRQGLAPA